MQTIYGLRGRMMHQRSFIDVSDGLLWGILMMGKAVQELGAGVYGDSAHFLSVLL